jgi:hypothetical protein
MRNRSATRRGWRGVCLAMSVMALAVSPGAAPAGKAASPRAARTAAAAVSKVPAPAAVLPAAVQIPCPFCSSDPIEPPWNEQGGNATRIKSPAPHMHFTAGVPLRILADALDTDAWVCPPGHPPYVCPGTEERFFVDGQLVGTAPPSTVDFNLWELRLPNGLPEGDHVLTVKYVPYNQATGGGGTPINGFVPITIHIDPAPVHGGTITLTQNLVLSGATDLDWTDKTIIGNGFRVTSAANYTGRVLIQGSMIRGLGNFTATGIDVTTSGTVSIQNSLFEATGAMRFAAQGSATLTVKDNELRANNMITYVADNPAVPVTLELVGGTSGAKVVQGNRLGGGMLRINGGSGWQIGGLGAGEGNVLIGVRAVLDLADTSHDNIQGNYLHHDYHGGFSQGFNLLLEGSSDHELAEHNVIRGGSWPIQTFGGEFRYNLVIDSGHTFWRSAQDNVQIHHNVFAHASALNTQYDGGIQVYSGESGIAIYNNTFDMAGATGGFYAPAVSIGSGSLFQSVRNNLFTSFIDIADNYGRAFMSTADGATSSPRLASADYNAFFNPLQTQSRSYLPGIVSAAAGVHDVQANPKIAGLAEVPFRIGEGCIWLGSCTASQVLAHYREIYRPTTGSPLINAADPADGAGTAIGAVGPDDSNPLDLFGRVLPAADPGPDVQPPTGTILVNGGATTTKTRAVTLTLSAFDQSGVTLMRFANDGGTLTAPEPYATTKAWTLTAGDGLKSVSVQYQDSVGNWSGSITATITLDTTVPPGDTTPPTVAITSPAAGSTVSGTITLTATAADNVGVAGVRFSIDGTPIGSEDTAAPYTASWNTTTVTDGSHSITARARDAAGNATTSAAIAVTVSNVVVTPPPPPPGGLVAAYGFEEGTGATTADASGNGLTGAVSQATWTTGKFGKALQFSVDQHESWVTVPNAPALGLTTGMTVSAWVKPVQAVPQWPSIVIKERPGDLTYSLYANSSTDEPNADYTSGGAEIGLNGGGTLPVGAWSHLAMTFDGAMLRLFVNGLPVASVASTGPIDVTTGVLRIGGNDVWWGQGFPGVIDEVRIYSRALSQQEIQTDMAAPVVSTAAPNTAAPNTHR